MRKLLGVAGALVLLAIAAPGAAHPQTAGACGWGLERSNAHWVSVFDYSRGFWTSIRYEVDTYNNGCGARVYNSSVVVLDGTPMTLQATIRVWVCGNYQGSLSFSTWTNGINVWSNTYWYGACPRQADNATSWSSSGVTWPASTSAYVNQG